MRASLFCHLLSLAVPFALLSSLVVLPPRDGSASARAVEPAQPKASAAIAGDDNLVHKVNKSIDEGIDFLKNQQNKADGTWRLAGHADAVGPTSLVMLALLTAGVKHDDPVIKAGLAFLRKNPAATTYGAGLQTMVFCLVGDRTDRAHVNRNVKYLLAGRMADGWTYTALRGGGLRGVADNSNTQYALLGLHEAIQSGAKVDRKVLLEVRDHFIKTQRRGAWNYSERASTSPTVNMTAAGLCNLVITGLDLAEGKAALRKDGSAADCGVYKDNEPVAAALDWLGGRFPSRLDDATAAETFQSPFYGIYGIERTGRLTGQRYLGGHDWYEVGCRWLTASQKGDGSWQGGRGALDRAPIVATSFALLFLSKGRTPVLISKLAYGGRDYMGWNNKRSDLKHVVEYCSRALFDNRPLAWQVFDIRNTEANTAASRRKLAAELLQAPIVFFNGHDFAPRDKEAEVLREFVNNGGFILAENCCGATRHPDFDGKFRKLVRDIFPDARLQRLEPEHPLWTASGKFASSPRDFPLWGVKQGCKTVVVYSPVPLAGYWEANLFNDNDRGQKAFELAANIVAYATGLEAPRPGRLWRREVAADDPNEKRKRGYLQVGQLRHEGDWQPAPRAMRNLMLEARRVGLDVVLKTKPVFATEEAVTNFRFLYMHGRTAFNVDRADLKHLRWNLTSGGLLLADACCGGPAFDASFRTFIKELFDGKHKLEPVPLSDELYGAELNGSAIKQVRRRTRVNNRVSPEFKSLPPALEGVKIKGRWVVIYSKVDIGCALEGHSSPDCWSHHPQSALRLARAALLYALKR